jgi:hypothetical protein
MNFNTYPNRGFLNTYFGFKLVDYNHDKKFRFTFSDGSSTDWVSENILVYKQFLKAGEQTIILETENETIEKTILIEDSLKLGNGKSLNIFFSENDNIIIQRKTTGIQVFFKHLNNKISKDILPDEIWNWNNSHFLFFTKSNKATKFPFGKFGFFDFEIGEFTEEFEGTFILYSEDNRKIISHEENKIFIRYPDKETTVSDGEFLAIDDTNSFLFFKTNNVLKQLNIAENVTTDIGEYEFHELTKALNLIVLKKDNFFLIWDIQKRFFIERRISSDYSVYSDGAIFKYKQEENSFKINFINANTRIEKTRFERFENHLSQDRKYFIRNSSLKYFQSFLIDELDKEFRIHKYNFKNVLIADLIEVEIEDKRRLFSLHKNRVEFQGEGEIVCGFRKDEKNYVIIKNTNEVSFFEYTSYLKLIQKYTGNFDIQYLDKLINQNNLWITISINHFKVFNGITKEEIKEIKKKETFCNWVLTEERKFLNVFTLEEKNSNFDSYYSINSSMTDGVIQKADGFYLVNIQKGDLTEKKIFDSDLVYTNCDVHPTGKIAVLTHPNMTEFLDLETFDFISVPDTSFIRIDHSGNFVLKDLMHHNASPRIFEPKTYTEIKHPNFNIFKFYSPDGKYKSNIGIESKEIQTIVPDQFVVENGIRRPLTITKIEKWVTIIDEKINKEYKVKVYEGTKWFNFLSFSFDNKFFALAGCNSGGVLELFSIEENDGINQVALLHQRNANWRCIFSPNKKYLACYDSNPITYIYSLSPINSVEMEKGVYKIQDRSVECYSQDSLFIVLSQHKYAAVTTGGIGWIPSSKIFISDSESRIEFLELDEHNTQVVFANFSSDGKKLISRSDDGIVVIRNFDYDKLVESKTELEKQQQTVDISK